MTDVELNELEKKIRKDSSILKSLDKEEKIQLREYIMKNEEHPQLSDLKFLEDDEKENEVLYKKVKGLKRPILVGYVNHKNIQIDQTGESIGQKVRRFLKDNEVNFQDIELEYDEEESVESNPDWSGDEVEFSDIDDISFDNIDAIDKARELKEKILSAQTTVVEPGDVPSDKLQTVSDTQDFSKQQIADEKQNDEST